MSKKRDPRIEPAPGTWASWIGKQVHKRSKKPFKSGSVVNTIKGMALHEQTGHPGFTFEEDDRVVQCWRCVLEN